MTFNIGDKVKVDLERVELNIKMEDEMDSALTILGEERYDILKKGNAEFVVKLKEDESFDNMILVTLNGIDFSYFREDELIKVN